MRASVSLALLGIASSCMAMTITVSTAEAAVVSCQGRVATIVGTSGDDTLIGTPGRDVIAARGGNDVVSSKGGNDQICGGFGSDQLRGGPGKDRLFGGMDAWVRFEDDGSTTRAGDSLRGGTGRDRLVPGRDTRSAGQVSPDQILWDTAPRAVRIDMADGIAVGTGPDTFVSAGVKIVGSRYGDIVNGTSRRDLIDGGPGSDTLRGFGGNDEIYAEFCCSNVVPGIDQVWGGPGNDALISYSGRDTIYAGRGNDLVADRGATSDLLYGGPGDDNIVALLQAPSRPRGYVGGKGLNRLGLTTVVEPDATAVNGTWNMQGGRLVLQGGPALTVTAVGFQRAELFGDTISWQITGTPADDELLAGGTAGTAFHALAGDDTFAGSLFADLFNGGSGSDHSLQMLDGADTCISVEILDAPDCEWVTP
jgi:Ca2+-binding RTX toxin-like protein